MTLAQLTLHEASDKLRKREISSVELTEAGAARLRQAMPADEIAPLHVL